MYSEQVDVKVMEYRSERMLGLNPTGRNSVRKASTKSTHGALSVRGCASHHREAVLVKKMIAWRVFSAVACDLRSYEEALDGREPGLAFDAVSGSLVERRVWEAEGGGAGKDNG